MALVAPIGPALWRKQNARQAILTETAVSVEKPRSLSDENGRAALYPLASQSGVTR